MGIEGMDLVRTTLSRYVRLTESEWHEVLPVWRERDFAKRELITGSGEVERWFSIVKEGTQRLFFEHDGKEACIGFSYGGTWSGVLDSFVQQRPSRFVLQALETSVLVSIHYDELQRLYARVPAMERFGRLILEELVVGRATREVEQLTLSAEDRYDRFMARSPQLVQLVAQKDIASYLGMSAETFSRLRALK